MKSKHLLKTVLALGLITAMLALTACGGDDDDEDVADDGNNTGIVQIGVTDKPDEDITAIKVTTDLIQASIESAEGPAELDETTTVEEEIEENDAEWITLLEGETSFDLIQVAGIEDILGQAELTEGTYNQIRMRVVSVIVTLNGEDVEARVPSGTIKMVRPFEVKAGETTVVTFDFNAERSVNVTGVRNVLFKPVVKLLIRDADEPFESADTGEEEADTDEVEGTPVAETEEPVAEFEPMIQTNEDGSFFLEITSPEQPEVFVDTQTVTIAGKTTIDAAVSIGEVFPEVGLDGSFQATITLEDDINIIDVVASISTTEQFSQVLTVIYAP